MSYSKAFFFSWLLTILHWNLYSWHWQINFFIDLIIFFFYGISKICIDSILMFKQTQICLHLRTKFHNIGTYKICTYFIIKTFKFNLIRNKFISKKILKALFKLFTMSFLLKTGHWIKLNSLERKAFCV